MRNKLRYISVILTVFTLLSALPLTAFAAETADLTIKTYEQFKAFAEDVNGGNTYLDKTVKLDVNLYLGGSDNEWKPIGTSKNPFKGTFDGNYHTVSGLHISAKSTSYLGLFGYVDCGTVKNLTVSGSVTGSGSVAGVIGYLKSGKAENCGNSATVSGGSGVGGVVGALNGASSVVNCYNSGKITSSIGYIGGVAGQGANKAKVKNCYNTGEVSGPATVGGVLGGHKAYNTSAENCYNKGSVTDTAGRKNNIGTVVGKTRGTVNNCYFLKGSGENTNGYGSEVTVIKADLLGSAFTAGTDYPILIWEKLLSTAKPVEPAFTEATERSALIAGYINAAVKSAKTYGSIEGTLLGNEKYLSAASSTATDWMALAMGRFGYYKSGKYRYMIDDSTGYENYLSAMKAYIENTYKNNNGILHSAKATEWHRAVVTITALGGDPENFGTYGGKPINLIADGSYNSPLKKGPGTQGINGWIWGLIAMDTGMYTVAENAKYTREDFITEIFKLQLCDGVNGNRYGGWVLGGYGSSSDVDITAMAIQSLAPYYNDDTIYTYTNKNSNTQVSKTVRQCVDEAFDRLSTMMNANAGFSSWNTDNVESISQVVVALCSVGINPFEDERFITADGKTLLDGMLRFRTSNGGFCHILNGGWNSMANDQATYALVSLWRLENGMRALYDMRSDFTKEDSAAINAAVSAINALPEPTSAEYKTKLKEALALFDAVTDSEKRYVNNYSKLASAIEIVGGTDELDTENPYIAAITVSKKPNKLVYFEGETFDTDGMIITALYNNSKTKTVTGYGLSVSGALKFGTNEIYITYGKLKTKLNITVNEKMPWNGEGTEASPYIIKSADDLSQLASRVNKGKSFSGEYFTMKNHIDLSDISNWTPIGKTSAYQFDGIFDGMGYAIDNLYSTSGGLFGYVGNNAIIKNVWISSGEIKAGNSSFVGAIAKRSNGADFINCRNSADIYCGGYSGGIVGTVRDGGESTVSGCLNDGNIISTSSAVGGIIGHLDTTRIGYVTVNVTVINCLNSGNITATDNAGGIVGRVQDGHTFKNCLNVGKITLTGKDTLDGAGGIISSVTNNNKIINCYYNSSLIPHGVSNGTDTAIGKTEEELKSEKFLNLLGSAFKADRYSILNGGYPLLSWQKAEEADSVDAVIEKINTIGEVTIESENSIKSARSAYNALADELKALISNYGILTDAETKLTELKNASNKSEPDNEKTDTPSDKTDKPSGDNGQSNSPLTGEKTNFDIGAITVLAIFAITSALHLKKKR